MDIISTNKKVEITEYGVAVKKNGDTYFVDLTITVNHQSGEVEEIINDILDIVGEHHEETLFDDNERLKIMEAAKSTF
jgi:hypothetical protein